MCTMIGGLHLSRSRGAIVLHWYYIKFLYSLRIYSYVVLLAGLELWIANHCSCSIAVFLVSQFTNSLQSRVNVQNKSITTITNSRLIKVLKTE